MRKFLLVTAAIVGTSAAASAADMAIKAPAMMAPPVPAFSWTGCYIGAHVGAGSMKDTWTSDVEGGSSGYNGVGAVAGGQIGCNYQIGVLVLGLESQGYWSGIETTLEGGPLGGGVGSWLSTKNKYDFDVAARFGIAFDRALFYGKAGWVWGRFDMDSNFGGRYSHVGEATLDGLLLGVGIEYALTSNWTTKIEYNYLNFGSSSVDFVHCEGGICVPEFYQSVSADKHIVKLGVNYKFGGGAPVVARY